MASNDLFGIDAPAEGAELPNFVIMQMTGADGWRAAYQSPAGIILRGLAGFALVEILPDQPPETPIPQRAIRPMVVRENGEVDDVEAFEDFLCVIPPGGDPDLCISMAATQQAAADD